MGTVEVEEECEGCGYVFFVVGVAFGVAKSAADEEGGSVADVAGNDSFRKFRLAEVREGSVDGVAEIDAGVDESAVEIEDEKAGRQGKRHCLMVMDLAGVSFLGNEEALCGMQ